MYVIGLRDAVQERDSQISSLKNTRDDLENKVLDLSNALADCEDRNKNTLSQVSYKYPSGNSA